MTEKRQAEQNAAQRQKELLAEAFDRARENDGAFLNAGGKAAPRLYPGGNTVSPFNSLFLSLHSERSGYKTNLYIPFPEAKKRGDAVQAGEKGVPFTWYRWNEYRNKSNPDQKISREEFDKLDTEQKKGFSPIRDREIRVERLALERFATARSVRSSISSRRRFLFPIKKPSQRP